MIAETARTLQASAPIWLPAAAGFGVVWNLYGAYQFAGSFFQTRESLVAIGMTASQAELYLSLPAWLSVVFAIGVLGGLAGSIALLMRRRIALPILAASLVGYVLLFGGDAYYGVFANIPTQLVILAVVVAIAIALFAVSVHAGKRSMLD
ncbi:MAG: hypothetical protein O9322_13120 [Beijerinckiaceae bacterium]|nr:hypothetical protein [Beijerinckiaceae bacterium]MCZ8300284.1 hypothetical protein [Beijerinckiaceae bacterium]